MNAARPGALRLLLDHGPPLAGGRGRPHVAVRVDAVVVAEAALPLEVVVVAVMAVEFAIVVWNKVAVCLS